MAFFVFHGETTALPHIGPTSSSRGASRAFFEGIVVAFWVGLNWRRLPQQTTEVAKVLLGCLTFGESNRPPFMDEFLRCHLAPHAPLSTLQLVLRVAKVGRDSRVAVNHSASRRSKSRLISASTVARPVSFHTRSIIFCASAFGRLAEFNAQSISSRAAKSF